MRRSSQLWRRANIIALLLILTIGIATFAIGKRMWAVTQAQQDQLPTARLQAASEPLPKEFLLDSFVPTGLPVTLSNVIARSLKSKDSKYDGTAQVKLQVSLPTVEKVQSLNFVLLGLKESGELELVKGWVRNVDFTTAQTVDLRLEVNRRIKDGDKLVLAVERAKSAATTYQTDFSALSQAVIANVRKQGELPVAVHRTTQALLDEAGAVLCNNALRRAMSLMQSSDKKGDKIGITSLRCDQQDRSYTIIYGKPSAGN
jgi:hypothetical protein